MNQPQPENVTQAAGLPGAGPAPACAAEAATARQRPVGELPVLRATENIYLPKVAVLDRVVDEIAEVKTFYWHFEDPAEQAAFRRFRPGQFAQVSCFGAGEFPASLPPSPTEEHVFFTIKQVGSVTAALHQMKAGAKFGVRGPYGNGFLRRRRHRHHPAAVLHHLRPREPREVQEDSGLPRRPRSPGPDVPGKSEAVAGDARL
jgi:hypothetical protein